ncbi:hypothetical protein HDU79_003447 [Rhizoclosmatium sp. JEL0117]|nr:hypothetical protein HDU79_003447 [Rhizoclosmatium sp. JEL0117]
MNESLNDELAALEAIWNQPPQSQFSWIEKETLNGALVQAHVSFSTQEPSKSARTASVSFVITNEYPTQIDSDSLKVDVYSTDGSVSPGGIATLSLVAKKVLSTATSGCPVLFDIGDAVMEAFLALSPEKPASARKDPTIPQLPNPTELCTPPFSITKGIRSHLADLSLQSLLEVAEKHAKTQCSESNLGNVFHIHPIASRKLLDAFIEKHLALLETDSQIWTPSLAFHATCNKDFIPSIITNGVLGAGDFTEDGTYIPMRHGAMYGQGIYVSPSMQYADRYSFEDQMENKQVIVCLVLPGNAKHLSEPKTKDEWELHNATIYNKPLPLGTDSHVLHARKLQPARTDAIFFGSTVSVFPRVSGESFFTSPDVCEMELESGRDFVGAYQAGVEIALRQEEEAIRQWENRASLVGDSAIEELEKEGEKLRTEWERLSEDKKQKRILEGKGPVILGDSEMKDQKDTIKERFVRKELKLAQRETIYTFVLITDGEDTVNGDETVDKTLEKYNKMLNGSGMKTLFKVGSVFKRK